MNVQTKSTNEENQRSLSSIELAFEGWYYWVNYDPNPTWIMDGGGQRYIIESVSFLPDHCAKDPELADKAFHVPGTWLYDTNSLLYNYLHGKIDQQEN